MNVRNKLHEWMLAYSEKCSVQYELVIKLMMLIKDDVTRSYIFFQQLAKGFFAIASTTGGKRRSCIIAEYGLDARSHMRRSIKCTWRR